MRTSILTMAIVFICSTSISFAELPHTFSAGQTAKASDVNENFQYVNKGNIAVMSGTKEIGIFVQYWSNSQILVLSDKGYFFIVDITTNSITTTEIFYQSSECNGQTYIDMTGNTRMFVQKALNSNNLYYVPANAAAATVQIASLYMSGQCIDYDAPLYVYELLANDQATTGVDSATFATPVTLVPR